MLLAGLALATGPGPRVIAHDLERTRVVVTFASDGTFQVDVVNNPDWLLERLEPFSGQPLSGRLDPGPRDRRLAELEETFARWVWVYFGDERLELAAEYIPPPRGPIDPNRPPLARMRLRGTVPEGAAAFHWAYGLVIDPYPLLLTRGDGRIVTHWVEGELESDRFDIAALTPPTTWRSSASPSATACSSSVPAT